MARSLEHLPVSAGGLARDKRRKLVAAIRAAGSLEQLHASLTASGPIPPACCSPIGRWALPQPWDFPQHPALPSS